MVYGLWRRSLRTAGLGSSGVGSLGGLWLHRDWATEGWQAFLPLHAVSGLVVPHWLTRASLTYGCLECVPWSLRFQGEYSWDKRERVCPFLAQPHNHSHLFLFIGGRRNKPLTWFRGASEQATWLGSGKAPGTESIVASIFKIYNLPQGLKLIWDC